MKLYSTITLACLASLGLTVGANAALAVAISGGSAILTLGEGTANSISVFNAYFNETATRAQTLSDPAPGNVPFTVPSAGVVQLVDPVRPSGVIPVPYPGTPGASRSPQLTTLDVEPADVLGNWSASNDAFVFVGNSTLGEQIAFTSMQRWSGPFTGSLLYGDFALRYVPSRAVGTNSGLVLTSNIDFLGAAYADLANASIVVNGNTLSITGDLLISGGLTALDPSAVLGTNFGTFALTAQLVPEPASVAMAAVGAVGLVMAGLGRRARRFV
jgi:hypothetical protein